MAKKYANLRKLKTQDRPDLAQNTIKSVILKKHRALGGAGLGNERETRYGAPGLFVRVLLGV